MLPRIFQRPLKFILWCTGVELVPTPASTTGFDIDDLAPRRAPHLFERILKAFCSLLFLVTSVVYVFRWWPWLLDADSYWCALPSAVWVLFMLLRHETPMDAEAIGVGLWTLSPFIAIAFEAGSGFVRLDLMPLQSLLRQAVAIGVMIAGGLIRDLVREMNPPA